MYELNDTIVAVSSPASEKRVIIRISGPNTIDVLQQTFSPLIRMDPALREPKEGPRLAGTQSRGLIRGSVAVDNGLKVDAKLYLFLAPHSYTGEALAEIHLYTNPSVTEALIGRLLGQGLRMAGPGEFTARAYLNGKIDLAQAEAVGEIVASSNTYQLAAAEKLLAGRLGETTEKVRSSLIDCLSLIEAGLDFSGEDIEFITRPEAIERLAEIRNQLQHLLSASISYESVIDLLAVGIAGAPNAGKSSLLNKLLSKPRSIVSEARKTTRDVLTGELELNHCRCVLFDCAGLVPSPNNILDELAQQAAIEALNNACMVVFCIDASKSDHSEDIAAYQAIRISGDQDIRAPGNPVSWYPGIPLVIPVATKSDLLSEEALSKHLIELSELFRPTAGLIWPGFARVDFLATSAKTGSGIELLRDTIDRKILDTVEATRDVGRGTSVRHPSSIFHRRARDEGRGTRDERLSSIVYRDAGVALTARHKQAVTLAIENITESITTLTCGEWKPHTSVCGCEVSPAWEITAMMLRAAYQAISDIESGPCRIDEQILDQIFGRFCIGK